MKLPKITIPLLAVIAIISGYNLRYVFTQPTSSVNFQNGEGKTVVCIVEGLKCKGTAKFFTRLYSEIPGIISIETFASEHKAVITFDTNEITDEGVRAIMEHPIQLRDGTSRQVFKCLSMEEQ